MVDASDTLAVERRLDAVHEHVLDLTRRVDALEHRSESAVGPGSTLQAPIVVIDEVAVHAPTPTPEPPLEPPPPTPQPRPTAVTPPASIEPDEASPILPLAIAGGAALLLGLALFAWHAMQQGWLGAGTRLGMGAAGAIGLTIAAWPLARRGHTAVAGAVGGAGLGAWFAAWLVARHAHDLVSAPQAFLALAAGTIACFVMADRLRLRLMAGLATLAACATPALIATGADRLGELTIYELVLFAGLVFLDRRRNWPELPTMGLIGAWALGMGWAAMHLGPHNGPALLGYGAMLLIATAASAWRLALNTLPESTERAHVALRFVLTGVVGWGASAWAFHDHLPSLGAATAVLAAWHLGLAVLLRRRKAPMLSRAVLWVGWVQAAIVPFVLFDGATAIAAWGVLALGAAALTWSGSNVTGPRLLVLPTVCAAVMAATHANAQWALAAGLLAAAVPFLVGAFPARARLPIPGLVGLGTVVWVVTVLTAGPHDDVLRLGWGMVVVAVLAVAALVRPSAERARLALVHLAVGLAATVATMVDLRAFDGASISGELLALISVLALLGAALCARIATHETRDTAPETLDLGGVVTAGFLGLSLAGIGALAMPHQLPIAHTAAIAFTGLALVVAGLRADRLTWRQLGLIAIGLAGAKVVVFDTAAVTLMGRALAFVGIGAVLILGAFAYSRAQRRAEAAASPRQPLAPAAPPCFGALGRR